MTRREIGLIGLLAGMAMSNHFMYGSNAVQEVDIKKLSKKPPKPPIPNGMKEWNINGVTVWAATKKAAIKKSFKK
jgi:hypothetical protein